MDETRGLISTQGIAKMPKGAVILNFARDPIVDETAALESWLPVTWVAMSPIFRPGRCSVMTR